MDAVPAFYLYGEPPRAAEERFLHLERLADRSRPADWTIRAHAHRDLVQLLVVEGGGGAMSLEDQAVRFAAPALLVVPRGLAHGFAWAAESSGWVLTLACGYLDAIVARHPTLQPLFAVPGPADLDAAARTEASARLKRLARELGWSAPGSAVAVEAELLGVLVWALRHRPLGGAAAAIGPAAALVARYRERVEARFRLREGLASHAAALGVSASALGAACRRVAATSPGAMLDARALLEAKRALLHSNLTVAQVGYGAGFADPAYFSRFFARHAHCSPLEYRRRRG